MSSNQEAPVFQRPDSVNSGERGIEEEDALLTGQRTGKHDSTIIAHHNRGKWREILLFAWALVATAGVVILAVIFQHNSQVGGGGGEGGESGRGEKRNLIFMVSDGMGPTSLELTRSWRQYTDALPWNDTLVLDSHLIGQSRTRSSSSLITDSAAGATAFSCGRKSYNGAISVLPDSFEPCGSVMEAAKRKGYTTGLVVTTRITDATPAVFASHVRRREMEDEIALQMVGETHPLGRMVDLMMGGGRCHFLPNVTEGGCREDGVDVVKTAEGMGWKYISTRKEFDGLRADVDLPLLALFAPTDIPYEVDRRHQNELYPSLEEMTKTALQALSDATKSSDQGFFIMIEGSRIDHAGHANDPGAQVHEVLAYDRAMSAVLDFINQEETPTLMISTSDHETGGLAAARQLHEQYPQYLWHPSVLANISHSASYVSHEYQSHLLKDGAASSSREAKETYIKTLVSKTLGIQDPSPVEMEDLIQHPDRASYLLADMISRRAQTGWSTHGHSGADVNIYTSDPIAAKALQGNVENTEIGEFLRTFLGLEEEVEEVGKLLREFGGREEEDAGVWMGSIPEEGERLDGQSHMDVYHGDHKAKRGDRCAVCGV